MAAIALPICSQSGHVFAAGRGPKELLAFTIDS
jgi:hypothetical protein